MVLDVKNMVDAGGAPLLPTPSEDALPRRLADFATLGDALDYAAEGQRGLNFHDARGALTRAYPFREMRADALTQARRLIAAGVKPEDRIALIAETGAAAHQLRRQPALYRPARRPARKLRPHDAVLSGRAVGDGG